MLFLLLLLLRPMSLLVEVGMLLAPVILRARV